MIKKELVFVLGSTGNMAFATANVIMGLVKNFNYCDFDIIVYCDEKFSPKDKELINSIKNTEFIIYNYFQENQDKFDGETLRRFTTLAFSRYECFKLLDKYQKVIWMDIDLLIKENINNIISESQTDIALFGREGILKNDFFKPVSGFDLDVMSYNSGVIVFSDSIKNPEEIADWCYEKTMEYAECLKCPDQAIINLVFQKFGLRVTTLPVEYNCHPDYKAESPHAKILHPFCMEKFWNFYNYREWNENYKNWLKMGGSKYTGKKFNVFEKFMINLKKKYFLEAPDPFRHTRKFIVWLINKHKKTVL